MIVHFYIRTKTGYNMLDITFQYGSNPPEINRFLSATGIYINLFPFYYNLRNYQDE